MTKCLHKIQGLAHPATHASLRHRFSSMGLLSLLLMVTNIAFGQQPVQVTTQLHAPYTLQLSDYYASTQEKLVVVLTNRDLNKPILNVRLRMSIESQSVQLRSKDFALLPTLALEAGVPLRLSLTDLAPYFNADNLDFSGLTRTQYAQQARLPEGFYQFCFEAIEISTGQIASAKSCAMAWMSLSDPPLLNLPAKGASFALKEPQNIIFQWTPRHLNSPNSAFVTEYDFQLVELWDNTLAPEVAFQSMQPLYEVTTRTTTLLYGPSQPLLLPGKRYGWRIRAHAKSGVEEVDVFRNQGFSEIYWFTYQDVCPVPTGIVATPGTLGNLQFSWLAVNRHTGYMVTYRQKDKASATWFDQQSSSALALVYDVQPGLSYEYRIGAFCNTDKPVYSDVYTVQLPPRNTSAYANCSIVPNPTIANKQALQVLKAGDVITAGDFPIKLSGVVGSGAFSGTGYVTVPFLGKAKVRVGFSNIQVNTQHQLMAGTVITLYDEDEGSVADVDEAVDIFRDYQGIVSRLLGFTADVDIDELKNVLDKLTENAEAELPPTEAEQVKENVKELLEAKEVYDYIKNTYDALSDSDDLKQSLKKDLDEASQKFDEIKSRFEGKDKDAVTSEKYSVRFDICVLPESTTYGFDAFKPSKMIESNYDIKTHGTDKYFIPWKAITTGEFDWVNVYSTTLGEVLPDNITFRTPTGALTSKPILLGKGIAVKLHGYGTDAGEKSEVIAYQTKEIDGKTVNVEIGKLNVVNYPRIYKKVVLVPLNDTRLPASQAAIQTRLNNIYRQAVVEWSVDVKPSLSSNYDVANDGLDDDESIIREHRYTPEMKTIIADYQRKEALNADVQYLFIIPYSKSRYRGYNPYMKQVGFVFMEEDERTEDGFVTTVAHELGHGAFNLRHTFDNTSIPKKSTDNLMDYHGDSQLYKFQWDLIHDPAFVIPLFESDEPAAYKTWSFVDGDVISNIPGYKDVVKSFLSITGKVITLPENASDFTFINGYLTAFTIGSDRYKSFVTETIPKRFIGYYSDLNQNKVGFDLGKAIPYGGQPTNGRPTIFYALPKSNGECGMYEIKQAEYVLPLGSTNDGGLNEPGEFYLKTEISTATSILENDKSVAFVQAGINCLRGAAKELFKFIEDHYAANGKPLSDEYKNTFVTLLLRYNKVLIKGVDVAFDEKFSESDVQIKIREMLNYGHTEFITKLTALTPSALTSDKPKNLIIEFEDYKRIKDTYLIYKITEKTNPNCTLGEQLQDEINKQLNENGKVEFNRGFFIAAAKTVYEMGSGNEYFELLSCLFDQLKFPEHIYNPNRFDHDQQIFVNELIKKLLIISIMEDSDYSLACSCGLWNSTVDIVKGMSDLGSGLTGNPDDLIKKTSEIAKNLSTREGWSALKAGLWTILKEHHGYVDGFGVDSYQATYAACYDIVFVASMVLGVNEVRALYAAAKVGDVAEMGRIILAATKNFPKDAVISMADIVLLVAKLPNVAVRKIIFEIANKIPYQLRISSLNGVKTLMIVNKTNGDIIAWFTENGIFTMTKSGGADAKVLYQSKENVIDAVSGKSGRVTLLADAEGNVIAALVGGEMVWEKAIVKFPVGEKINGVDVVAKFFNAAQPDELVGVLLRTSVDDYKLTYKFEYYKNDGGIVTTENLSVSLEDGVLKAKVNLDDVGVLDVGSTILLDGVKYFKERVESVADVWLEDVRGRVSSDLEAYRKALADGKNPQEAAFSTPTGNKLSELGFDLVEFSGDNLGTLKEIRVIFKKSFRVAGLVVDDVGTIGVLSREVKNSTLNYVFKVPGRADMSFSVSLEKGILKLNFDIEKIDAVNGLSTALFKDIEDHFGGTSIKCIDVTMASEIEKASKPAEAALSTAVGKFARKLELSVIAFPKGLIKSSEGRIAVLFLPRRRIVQEITDQAGNVFGILYREENIDKQGRLVFSFESTDGTVMLYNQIMFLDKDGFINGDLNLQEVRGRGIGSAIFGDAMNHFQGRVNGFVAAFGKSTSYTLGESDILIEFKRGLATLDPEDAALATVAGKWAARFHFTKVRFEGDHSINATSVVAIFTLEDVGFVTKIYTIDPSGKAMIIGRLYGESEAGSNFRKFTFRPFDSDRSIVHETVSINNGVLNASFKFLKSEELLLTSEERSSLARALLNDVVERFHDRIEVITDVWHVDSENYRRYVQALQTGSTYELAAFSTPVGGHARNLGLTRVVFPEETEVFPRTKGLVVHFKRPGTFLTHCTDNKGSVIGALHRDQSIENDRYLYYFEPINGSRDINLTLSLLDGILVVDLAPLVGVRGATEICLAILRDLKLQLVDQPNAINALQYYWRNGDESHLAFSEVLTKYPDWEDAASVTLLGRNASEQFGLTSADIIRQPLGFGVMFVKESKGYVKKLYDRLGRSIGKLYEVTEDNTTQYLLKLTEKKDGMDVSLANQVHLNDTENIIDLSFQLKQVEGRGATEQLLDVVNERFEIEKRNGIRVFWNINSEDLAVYREGTSTGGLTPNDAALSTPMGRWAERNGFTSVMFDGNVEGNNNGITVVFGKRSATELVDRSRDYINYHVSDAFFSEIRATAYVRSSFPAYEVDLAMANEKLLDITINAVTRNGSVGTGLLKGEQQFKRILQFFDGEFESIFYNFQGRDLGEFNDLVRQGKSKSDAALATWFGVEAKHAGYSIIKFIDATQNSTGEYSLVKVIFRKS